MIKSRVTISCMASDFENDSVFLTKREQDCLKVQYKRMGFAPIVCGRSPHFDRQSQTLRFDEFDGT